jgi:primosomal replication protein N''
MMRYCPNCQSERALAEFYCDGEVNGGPCDWDLSQVAVRPTGWRPTTEADANAPAPAAATCPEGHPLEAGDMICATCGADIVATGDPVTSEAEAEPPALAAPEDATIIAGWHLQGRLASSTDVWERFEAVSEETGRAGVLTLYAQGHEPDPDVYAALRTLPHDHVPEVFAIGRWEDRAFEVSENVKGGALSDLGQLPQDYETLATVVGELGGALNALAECGIRHRDLRPSSILIRAQSPLDLVVSSFGSASLSQFDLDIVSPLETSRYTAPEAVAGGVAAASDWWSLGIILLEQVTQGACFEGVNDQAFLIHVLTNGVVLPEGLDPRVELLLRGLLARDRHERWGWPQVREWLAGETPWAPQTNDTAREETAARSISLGGRLHANPRSFALAAALAENWDAALDLLRTGALASWTEEARLDVKIQSEVGQITRLEEVADDLKLALALKALNPFLPLTARGEIITPSWLLDHPDAGYALISGPVPELLARMGSELWLERLKTRAGQVRERAKQLDIVLEEAELCVHLLSTSRTRLATEWTARRRVLPDTDHAGLIAILERRQTTEEDYILLLAASVGQFRTADAIIAEAAEAAERAGVKTFDPISAEALLERPRRDLYAEIETRLENFARCGLGRVDEWADQFRLERRLPIGRALALLAVDEDLWREPPKQTYVSTLLDFFAKRITGAVLRGPLTRLVIGKTTARIDVTELGTSRRSAAEILDHLLLRNGLPIDVDPAAFVEGETVERRLRTLYSHATLYRRDTGIDGLYLGFPFLLMKEPKANVRPRVAPVLLWPVKLNPEVGARGKVSIAFDREREEVRLNPAFEPLLGPDTTQKWKAIAQDLLGRATLTAADVMDAFGERAALDTRTVAPLPGREVAVDPGTDRIACSAVFFHLAYIGQAVMEDLRQLKSIPPTGTSLETALRVSEFSDRPAISRGAEIDRFFTAASDPSQEAAVLQARLHPGLLIEGPPGTGKSQTIVNMVADAIGRRQSLLIVCQKQAALDVVMKRLEAEGLGNRLVMITDVNKDRRRVVGAVREQLDALWSRPASATASWRQRRQQVAARIEALEAELDQHHVALHALDESAGLSYRLILSDLIGYEAGLRLPIDAPGLRKLLASQSVAQIVALEEACGPLARLWLPARFEGSALSALKPFSPDGGTIDAFGRDFAAFIVAEQGRLDVIKGTPVARRVDDPVPYQAWTAANAEAFRRIDAPTWGRLVAWSSFFPQGSDGLDVLPDRLAALAEGFEALPATTGHKAEALAEGMTIQQLSSWTETIDALLHPPTFIQRLSLTRWGRSSRAQKWLRQNGLSSADMAAVSKALHAEAALRPWRVLYEDLQPQLEPAKDPSGLSPADLAADVRRLAREACEVRELIRRVAEHPNALELQQAATSLDKFEIFLSAIEQGYLRHEARGLSLAALEALEPWIGEAWRSDRQVEIEADASSEASLTKMSGVLATTPHYQRFRPRASQLDPLVLKVLAVLRGVEAALHDLPERDLEAEVRRIIGRESRLAWKTRAESERPVLLLEGAELSAKAEALAASDKEMRELNGHLLVDGIDASQLRPPREWEDITRLQGQRARRLREFLDRGADLGLMALRPVWLMNPDVASRVLPLRSGLFDTVIYDEASQMPVEYALPTLFRSKAMIVSGDEKQMPPTAFFTSRVENDEADAFDGTEADENASEEEREEFSETWNRREIKDCPDLLQLAKTVLPNTTLQIHYRSVYRELIEFSNAAFYSNRLSVPARHPDAEVRRVRPIELVRAEGVYQDQVNPEEARCVAAIVAELWKAPIDSRPSVGVVTFNRKQADLIETVLEERAERDAVFREALAEERERFDDGEDMGFFIKNVENVQGDERDIIVFSSTFGRNAQGTFRRSFGVLGQKGGERRLNVAVTRAREKVIMVTSMPIPLISDMLSTRRPAASPRDFMQAYFEYARAVSAGELDNARTLLGRLVSERRPEGRGRDGVHDGFQDSVAAFIRETGWEPTSTTDAGAFGVDFAVVDPATGMFGLAIECDAPQHGLLEHARAREMWRPSVLKRSIPALHRVSSHAWYHDAEGERGRLRDALKYALSQREPA